MTRRARKKSPHKRWSDPGQLGLFDAADTRAPARNGAPTKRPKSLQTGHARPAPSPPPERAVVLSPREAALYLGVSVSTLKAWRAKKIGPKWSMRGARLVAYRPADLERFLDDSTAGR